MKIIIAKHIGYCSGVKRAVDTARIALEKDPKPISFLGELVHNEKTINEIKEKGGIIIKSLDDSKEGTIIIRAHGVPPFTKPENIEIRDTTCPLVKKAQMATKTLFNNGYQVVIIGERDHSEVKGINGYAKNAIIIENLEEANQLNSIEKLGVVSQTTQNIKKVEKIIKCLKQKSHDFKWINTLCPEVISRQKELEKIFNSAEGILVIGSKTSANTMRLMEIAKDKKKKAWIANFEKEVKEIDFENIESLGVISGTSAPNEEIEKITKFLKSKFNN